MPTALVTGANKGIGHGSARGLAQQGFKVWIGVRDTAQGEAAAAEMRAEGLDVSSVHLDVTDEASIHAAVEVVQSGHSELDVLVNNAGINNENDESANTFGAMIPPSAVPLDKLRAVYDVNFFGAVAVTQAFLPLLRKSPAGRIVNMSSGLGSFALNTDPSFPFRSLNALGYKSSKTALNMATVLFAYELRDTPIKVNSANPGLVATDLNGPGSAEKLQGQSGFTSPEQGARIVLKLATLPADGPTGGFFDYDDGELPW